MPAHRVETIAPGITLHLGDCREIAPGLAPVDAIVTDPPYGIAEIWKGGSSDGWETARLDGNRSQWDSAPPSNEFLRTLCNGKPSILWGGNYFEMPASRGWLVWDKKQPGFSTGDCELAWTNCDHPIRTFVIGRNVFTPIHSNPEIKEHTSQKPLQLMQWCLGFLPKAKVIFDPFMGSGTTGVACVTLGRQFTGIEIEEKYFDIACRRIEQATKQPDMFIERAAAPKQESWNEMWRKSYTGPPSNGMPWDEQE